MGPKDRLLLLAGSSTLDHIVKSALESTSPPCVLYIADFCYAGKAPPKPDTSIRLRQYAACSIDWR